MCTCSTRCMWLYRLHSGTSSVEWSYEHSLKSAPCARLYAARSRWSQSCSILHGLKGKDGRGVKGGRKWRRRGESNFKLVAPFLLFTACTYTYEQSRSLNKSHPLSLISCPVVFSWTTSSETTKKQSCSLHRCPSTTHSSSCTPQGPLDRQSAWCTRKG